MFFEKHEEKREGIFVTRPELPPIEEYIEYLKKIWENSILTNMGPLHEDLPLYSALTDDEVYYICEMVKTIVEVDFDEAAGL